MKSILLDSHTLIWALGQPDTIQEDARRAISDPANAVFYSAASVWEIEIKAAKGKLHLPPGWLDSVARTGFIELPVLSAHAAASARLPWHHNDPFDRILIAQAAANGFRFATRDRIAALYGVTILPV